MHDREPYSVLAAYYDGGWSDYSGYAAELIERLAAESGRHFDSICDAACGTGLLLQALDDGRRRLSGYDRSREMIELAEARLFRAELAVGDLREPPPCPGPVDLVTCMYDAANYLLDEAELGAFLRNARSLVGPDGVLVMDCNDASMYAERDGQVHHRLIDGVGIRERLAFTPGPPAVATTVFEFPHARERHVQRAWEPTEVESLMERSGWTVLDSLDVMDDERDERSGKVVYIGVAAPLPD